MGGNKNKTVSFRVNEDSFEALQDIADHRDLSLSSLFRDYVDMLNSHEGRVEIVPQYRIDNDAEGRPPEEFPPKITVPKRFVREHERLELEADHLREQLDEYKQYATKLQDELDATENGEVIHLGDLDRDQDFM